MVCPMTCRPITEHIIASGIDVATINVLRQLPKSASIINAVNPAAVTASLITSPTHSLTNLDWSVRTSMLTPSMTIFRTLGSASIMRLTTDRVDASPFFKMLNRTARRPLWLTTFN